MVQGAAAGADWFGLGGAIAGSRLSASVGDVEGGGARREGTATLTEHASVVTGRCGRALGALCLATLVRRLTIAAGGDGRGDGPCRLPVLVGGRVPGSGERARLGALAFLLPRMRGRLSRPTLARRSARLRGPHARRRARQLGPRTSSSRTSGWHWSGRMNESATVVEWCFGGCDPFPGAPGTVQMNKIGITAIRPAALVSKTKLQSKPVLLGI